MKKTETHGAEGRAAPDRTTEEIGALCAAVVNKYTKPNINARTMMQMPEFWSDISKALRGEPVDGIDIPGIGDVAPTLSSLTPATAELNSPDLTLHCIGTDFTAESVIVFAEVEEPTTFVSATEITTGVKPSLGWGAVSVPVSVKTGEVYTNPLDFTFTEAAAAAAPILLSTSPSVTQPDQGNLTMQATGSGFVDGCAVHMDGVAQTTTFTSDTSLLATIPTAGVALGDHPITVVNPDLQESNARQLEFVPVAADTEDADDEGSSRRKRRR